MAMICSLNHSRRFFFPQIQDEYFCCIGSIDCESESTLKTMPLNILSGLTLLLQKPWPRRRALHGHLRVDAMEKVVKNVGRDETRTLTPDGHSFLRRKKRLLL